MTEQMLKGLQGLLLVAVIAIIVYSVTAYTNRNDTADTIFQTEEVQTHTTEEAFGYER